MIFFVEIPIISSSTPLSHRHLSFQGRQVITKLRNILTISTSSRNFSTLDAHHPILTFPPSPNSRILSFLNSHTHAFCLLAGFEHLNIQINQAKNTFPHSACLQALSKLLNSITHLPVPQACVVCLRALLKIELIAASHVSLAMCRGLEQTHLPVPQACEP